MSIPDEQANKIKEQLLKQLEHFPEDKRIAVREQIESMTSEQVEAFVKENNLNKKEECIFCSISEDKIPSYKIAENESAIAILEINPLGKGHTLIVPKSHDSDITPDIRKFAETIANRLNETFSPNEIQISQNSIMGHKILEIKPNYGEVQERKRASEEELKTVQTEIVSRNEETKDIKTEKTEERKIYKIKQRIP